MNTSSTRRILLSLAALTLVMAGAAPLLAGERIAITVEGSKQGPFKTESPNPREKVIPVLKFSMEVVSPRDLATGQASGKRQYKPIVITKEIGASSPQFFEAVMTNEVLKTVTVEFFRTGSELRGAAGAGEVMFYTIKLTNVSVASVREYTGEGADAGKQLQEISLSFQKIEISELTEKATASDSWQSQQ